MIVNRARARKPSGKIGYALLLFGTIALISSILYSSSMLAFIGIALTFWGAILLYIQPEEYTKKVLLDATLLPSLAALDQIMQELDYKGKAIYLPPKYLNDPEANKVYISKQKDEKLPTPELILKQESKLFIQNPQGILLTPPGAELTKLFEETLGTSFTKTDLQYLQKNMPKLFIEDLEIAENLEIQTKYDEVSTIATDSVSFGRAQTKFDTIHVKITNSVYKDMCKEARKLSRVCNAIGCPICGAIACALAKATGKPVIIEETEVSEDGKTIEANFRLLETIESEVPIEELLSEAIALEVSRARMRLLLSLAALFLTAFGSFTLAWVGQLTWYDMTAWGKDIGLIFFGSRTGEQISLGIGMKVIYYFLIGLALLLSGLLTFLLRQIKAWELHLSRRLLLNLAALFLTAFGSIILAWVGQLTWYDMTAWGKDIGLIFFGSRTGEQISLGIGMKVIYYFLIGLALLLSGLLTFLRRQIKV